MGESAKPYRHITVSADEEDVVIQAGSRPTPSAEGAQPLDADAFAPSADVSPESGADKEAVRSTVGDSAAKGAEAAPQRASKQPSDNGNSLEDLQGGTSVMQKAIIILAVVAVAAFVAWCIFH